MTDDIYRSQFRLPYPLYEQLKAASDENRRSVNAELVARLEASFSPLTNVDRPLHGISVSEDGTERTLYSGPAPKEMFRIIGELAEQVRLLREEREEQKK
ncbi:Arc family DNA-binding protein [Pseudomonas sp. GD04058]|uniref:Arc family DNA-binding protein n=1 Tax=Pseudomonas TaxID=286 RepID=UPI0023651482|nr:MULTISPECIES: Arc family DNA-binding protein [Pseudomonas]MDD2046093.1 Arc family DNA-binding protein [Pseudomonas putida]MDG9885400.1 Arc family DNA-binding protein [Pseudomonas sp. GD04058]